jgi:hypothetical protein
MSVVATQAWLVQARAHPYGHVVAMTGGFILGVLGAFVVFLALLVAAVAIAGLVVGDAYWGGFVVGYFGQSVILGLGPIALLIGGVVGARSALRRRPHTVSIYDRKGNVKDVVDVRHRATSGSS